MGELPCKLPEPRKRAVGKLAPLVFGKAAECVEAQVDEVPKPRLAQAFPPVKVELPPVKAELPPEVEELPAKATSEAFLGTCLSWVYGGFHLWCEDETHRSGPAFLLTRSELAEGLRLASALQLPFRSEAGPAGLLPKLAGRH